MFRVRAAAAVTVVSVAALLGYFFGGSAPAGGRAPLAVAVAGVPADVSVLGFTQWEKVLARYSVPEALDRDLSTRSVLIDSDLAEIRSVLGWRLRDVAWELYAQDRTGDVAVIGLKRNVTSEDRLRKAGYEYDGKIWRATGRLEDQQPLYRFVVPMPKRNLMVMSEGYDAVEKTLAVMNGRATSLASNSHVTAIVQALAGSQSALVQVGELGCDATVAAIDADAVRQVRAAQATHGKLAAYRWLGRGLSDDGTSLQTFIVAMPFGSAAAASRQAETRAAMSVGPFIGRAGDMSEVLRLRDARSDGNTAVLTYAHPANSDFLMTGHGPLLPASC